jgi:hypothetical protein
VRRDVAAAAWIGVVAPGAAEIAGSLQYDEIVPAGPRQADGGADAGEAGTNDGHCNLILQLVVNQREQGQIHHRRQRP